MAACHVGANNLAFRRGSMAGASVNLTVKRASARSESALDAFERDGITAAEGQRGRGALVFAQVHADAMLFLKGLDQRGIGVVAPDERIQILGCGTALHAGQIARYLIEGLAGLPVEFDFASEFRYRSPRVAPGTVALAITQSGETADTLGATRLARNRSHALNRPVRPRPLLLPRVKPVSR